MRCNTTLLVLLTVAGSSIAEEPKFVAKPKAFETLVNPSCSHCVDEAKRRAPELQDTDPVLCWTRGKYDGGTIPIRFFLNQYRVISDTYGTFVYDPDAGYARSFPASLDYQFHGWRNGVMVMRHKDGTLFSCLSGVAFEGPRKNEKLPFWPTIVADWGWAMKSYPNGVAYRMDKKFVPTEVPTKPTEEAISSRGMKDPRLPAEEMVLGVAAPSLRANPRVYPIGELQKMGKFGVIGDTFECGQKAVILWQPATNTAMAYAPVAENHQVTSKLGVEGDLIESKPVSLEVDGDGIAPFLDKKTGSRFDIAGRCREGELKGWTLKPLEAVQVKWFAWAAEFPRTTIYKPQAKPKAEPKQPTTADDAIKEVAGTAEFLRAIPKHFALVEAVDAKKQKVTLRIEGEKLAKEWPVEPDAEIKLQGWWGRLAQIKKGSRVWVWFKADRSQVPRSVLMLCDEPTEQEIHLRLPADPKIEEARLQQKDWLRKRWLSEGLPGSVMFVHLATGEIDIMLDHEAMRWARSMQRGNKVTLQGIDAIVKTVTPDRERTHLRLVMNSLDMGELRAGQRIFLKMVAPPASLDDSPYPPDLERKRSRDEQIEWFLASIYCTCGIKDNTCTGHFYTLASCNPNGCGAPNATRRKIAAHLDEGLSPKAIFDKLLADRGKLMLQPHLLP